MDKKLFIYLFLAFIAATIIGTISHEFGHYMAAKCLGYNATINYAYTHLLPSNHQMTEEDHFLFTLGGPMQTLLTGTIGLILLFLNRTNFYTAEKLSSGQWLLIFITLFWLRQTANLCTWLGGYFIHGKFGTRGDEIKIAKHLHLPNWAIVSITALIGALILYFVVFKFIPKKQRFTFMASGLLGGIAGYVFWLVLFGKYIMP